MQYNGCNKSIHGFFKKVKIGPAELELISINVFSTVSRVIVFAHGNLSLYSNLCMKIIALLKTHPLQLPAVQTTGRLGPLQPSLQRHPQVHHFNGRQ